MMKSIYGKTRVYVCSTIKYGIGPFSVGVDLQGQAR